MPNISASGFDVVEMHERACKAIAALGRTQREVGKLMGVDVSLPPHKQVAPKPTTENIIKTARILGVSVKWLTTGIPETHLDFIVSRPFVALYGHNVITGNSNSEIEINGHKGEQPPRKQ